ncbi:MAG: hypothetical protein ACKVW3_07290 [Phycisphaerales bacterium]
MNHARASNLRRGALLFEVILALGIFVGSGLAILASVDRALVAQDRVRLSSRAADLARTAMARIEAGLDTPQTLHGPVRDRSLDPDAERTGSGGGAAAGGRGATDARAEGWELRIETEPSQFAGLTHVTVTAERLDASGAIDASFTLHQLVRLRVDEDTVGGEDEIARRAREAPKAPGPRASPAPGRNTPGRNAPPRSEPRR